jgi:hypothetical protein
MVTIRSENKMRNSIKSALLGLAGLVTIAFTSCAIDFQNQCKQFYETKASESANLQEKEVALKRAEKFSLLSGVAQAERVGGIGLIFGAGYMLGKRRYAITKRVLYGGGAK